MKSRRKLTSLALLIVIMMMGVRTAHSSSESYLNLSGTEYLYIEEVNPIKICVDPDWYPYEKIDESGNYIGIASDLIEIISVRTGIEFEVVQTEDWNQSLEYSKLGKCDALAFLNETEERSKWLKFTDTYFSDPNVIITREDHQPVTDLASLENKKVALPEGTSVEERIRSKFPNLEIVVVDSENTAIEYVENRKADMTVRSLSMAAYVIKEEGLFNLKIAGEIPGLDNNFKIGVASGDEVLVEILNKGIATITDEDLERVKNEHISVNIEKTFNYKAFLIGSGIFATIFLAVLVWIKQLKSLNNKLRSRQEELSILSKQLSESEALYKSILSASPNAIIISDREGYISMISPATIRILGYQGDESPVGRNIMELLDRDSQLKAKEDIEAIYRGESTGIVEYIGVRKDKSRFNIESSSDLIRDEEGNPKDMVSVVRDVTEKKKIEEELRKSEEKYRMLSEELQRKNEALSESSIVDQLTGIKNRRYFDQKINEEKNRADRQGTKFSIILFDLDKFKSVNDAYGHDIGDDVIVKTVEVISKIIRQTDSFARWGGEEFTVLMENTGIEGAIEEAERMRSAVENIEHPVAGKVTISIGVSEYTLGEKVETLFKRADEALYEAKRSGRNKVISNV
ncbi:putative diguanylate cyclase YdaM [Andreesenia angusta]|uniref:Putative diguanylate cyclase YdaM n=1 Tax=Andreesenia angusta TaxID=39480 RepID=A0A1S1V5L5_9FIRM|nr:diguanylate cyclase [Andreesenia angusta]OHW61690.1 putative diguanylate cyclase YdaM [Andreesenia angusta]